MSCHSGTWRGHRRPTPRRCMRRAVTMQSDIINTMRAHCTLPLPSFRNFDGSSTGQAPGHDSEVLLNPVYMVPDPFRERPNIIVLCECLTPSGETIPTNTRRKAAALFDMDKAAKPWFGLEQEYTMFALDGRTPLGWPVNGFPRPQGPYYWYVRAPVTQRMPHAGHGAQHACLSALLPTLLTAALALSVRMVALSWMPTSVPACMQA